MVRLEQRLKEERLRRKISLEEAAKATKIKPHFLEAIERGAYNELPSPAYAKGFVRNYADYLGLPKIQTAAFFKRDFDEKRAIQVLPEGMTNSRDFPRKRLNVRRVIIGTLVFLAVVSFFLFQTRDTFIAPSVHIKSPKEGSVVGRDVEVLGKTANNAIITVNNDPVFVQSNGEFVKKITLFPGKTSIVIKAKNRKGLETLHTLSLTVR